MRWAVIALAGATCVIAGCSTIGNAVDALNPFSKSAPKLKPAELPSFKPIADLARAWQGSVGSAENQVFTPAVVGRSVYVAARDGTVMRLEDGKTLWRINAGQVLSGGVGASDAVVVVGTSKGEVLVFQASDGRAVWQAKSSSEILAAPAVSDDLVVVRSGDARILGFDIADGKRRWVYQRATPPLALRSQVGVLLSDKAIYAGFPGGKLVALSRANGAALWESAVAQPRGTTELERVADVASDPVVEGGSVCAVAYQGRVACFDIDNGRQLWAREISSVAGLDIGNRALYVTDDKGGVQAFDRNNGASLWKQEKLARRGLTRPLAVGTRVVVGDFEGYVHVLSEEDGGFVARAATDGSPIHAAPRRLRGDNDAFVVQTRNGAVSTFVIR